MGDLKDKKLLKRLSIDMYFSLTLKNIDRILTIVNIVKSKGKGTAKVNAGLVVFKITYPTDDKIYDTVDFSYYNKGNGLYISSSEYLMDDLLKAIKMAYVKSSKGFE